MVEKLIDEGVNLVQIGRETGDERISQVLTDPKVGAEAVTAHLLEQGVSNFWLMSYPAGKKHLDVRTGTFMDCIRRAGCSEPKLLRISSNANTPTMIAEEAYQIIRQRLSESKTPQGILAMSDTLAYGTMRAMYEKDIRVGRDVAVTGYDDIWMSQFTSPPLTTVNQPDARDGIGVG